MAPAGSPTMFHRKNLSDAGKDAAAVRSQIQSATIDGIPSTESWSPSSWTRKPIKQDAVYKDRILVEQALTKLERLPPIVTPAEICRLRTQLRDVALGNGFLLQGGDCAELFDYCESQSIDAKIKLLLQMSLILIYGARKPVVRIARMAGQYAKPRSSPTEIVDGKEVPSFRGDILNGYYLEARALDPARLISAYMHSAATLNYVRAQLSSGFADLNHPLDWGLGHVKDLDLQEKYQRIATAVTESLAFMHTVGAARSSQLESVELYTSHEGLLLDYEQSLTRLLPYPTGYTTASSSQRSNGEAKTKGWFNVSAHFLWIGDRTRQIDGAHVEYFRGIENPIGIKVGPTMEAGELVQLLDVVNPQREVGKVTLITRYGSAKIAGKLGDHIEAVKRSGHTVVWQCDPMHGNTKTTSDKVKTRDFSDIISEVSSALRIHAEHKSFLGGVHLELTGDAVTECVGGGEELKEEDLNLNYTTYCDPRLNEKQALDLAFLITSHIRGDSKLDPAKSADRKS